ncbi:isochorismatase family protein [Streptacidiphilus sp. P02-A3a]|uniref:isochorismatase family protein n=1 Tax=Streptacidiphilus sp. P02-A3a TaxID=2704468 RepID=UPI0015F8B95F|nr:isochorismatase family protein [Streptacidiphilus sp. P02-A3a]QMU70661.1 isochorismatase family protein [Streptacidiphilus sp. P02-A3a]
MRRALIVVDVQKDFCEGGSVPVKGGADRASAIADLVRRSAGHTYAGVVATRDHHIDPGGHFSDRPDFSTSFPVHCVVGTEGGDFHPGFVPVTTDGSVDEVFYKGAHSASKSGFEGSTKDGTSLADWLRARQIEAVDVVGIATDHCVKATALDGARAGFTVRVLLDYTAGVAPDTTRTALSEMRHAGVHLTGHPVVHA